jgi:hypothetical protein
VAVQQHHTVHCPARLDVYREVSQHHGQHHPVVKLVCFGWSLAACQLCLCLDIKQSSGWPTSSRHHSGCKTPNIFHQGQTAHAWVYVNLEHAAHCQALLPVPPSNEQPAQLSELWANSKTFSKCYWPTLFAVRALSNCTILVLDADAFFTLLREYSWVGASRASGSAFTVLRHGENDINTMASMC